MQQDIIIDNKIRDMFDNFMLSSDRRVLTKLLWRSEFFQKTINVPGDIAECGVFKGTGLSAWLKIKKIFSPNTHKKVIGFDFFNTESLLNTLDGVDKENMSTLFNQRNFIYSDDYKEILENKLYEIGFNPIDFELIKGDVIDATLDYKKERVGAKFSIIYLDCDVAEPTYAILNNLWDNLSVGGYAIFDEYGYHQWSESVGADRFAKERGLSIEAIPAETPTAFIKKV